MIGILVEIVVLQEQVATRDDADIAVAVTTDVHSSGVVVSSSQVLGNFEHHAVPALHVAIDTDNAHGLKMTGDEGIVKADNEIVLSQATVVNVLVVVPRVPVVGVVSRRNLSSA